MFCRARRPAPQLSDALEDIVKLAQSDPPAAIDFVSAFKPKENICLDLRRAVLRGSQIQRQCGRNLSMKSGGPTDPLFSVSVLIGSPKSVVRWQTVMRDIGGIGDRKIFSCGKGSSLEQNEYRVQHALHRLSRRQHAVAVPTSGFQVHRAECDAAAQGERGRRGGAAVDSVWGNGVEALVPKKTRTEHATMDVKASEDHKELKEL
ncbi:hypothetical protein BOTBODRAFT_189919 [Botryobasidium botryosum FD-172 SS1]|uniref:Uncharacterized protein n=1 Tax=Botryobasidium botryosum (strain FD-172 SS1) TaxID=930990 RepID=A0A067M6K4_BOTB1|nr:hypothetical protein BOTBODRAFT_189919 [Botryobasidium botryosum FD-172 SS1]